MATQEGPPTPGSAAAVERLRRLPEDVRETIQQGFSALARVAPDKRGDLVRLVIQSGGHSRYGQSTRDAAVLLGLSPDEAADVLGALSALLHIGVMGAEPGAVEFVSSAIKSGLIPPDASDTAREIAAGFDANRVGYAAAHDRVDLANRVLPSLESFDASVDVRFGFREGVMVTYAPVVVASLSTDAPEGGMIFFQLTRDQVDRLLSELSDLKEKLDKADAVVKKGTGR